MELTARKALRYKTKELPLLCCPLSGVCVGRQRPWPAGQRHHHRQPQTSLGAGSGGLQDHAGRLRVFTFRCLGNHRPLHTHLPRTSAFLSSQGSLGGHAVGLVFLFFLLLMTGVGVGGGVLLKLTASFVVVVRSVSKLCFTNS